MKVSVGDLVWIKWEDHYGVGDGGWADPRDVTLLPIQCETVGWVIKQDRYRLATTPGHDGQVNPNVHAGHTVILKRTIVEMEVLRKRNPKIWKSK